jgi:hypothetical protein
MKDLCKHDALFGALICGLNLEPGAAVALV